MFMKNMRTGIILLLVAPALAACGGSTISLDMQTIEQGYLSGIISDTPQVFKIDTQEGWDDFWARHKSRETPPPVQPSVDFLRYSVIAVVDKEESSGGFTMEIDSITVRDAILHLQATRTEPGPGCVITFSLTEPFHIVRIDKSVLRPELDLSIKTFDCSR